MQTYFNYKFPEPQYLGGKYRHLSWIKKFIPKDIDIAIDAFAGSQSVAFLFKQLGFQTITNDLLNFNNQIGTALIENKDDKITLEDQEVLFQSAKDKSSFQLMNTLFSNVFFDEIEAYFLDNFRANISLLSNIRKQALAYAVMNRSMTRKITMGHFAHTQALKYANDPIRVKRNRSLVLSIKEIFLDLLSKYNNAVFDNKRDNISYNKNIFDLLPTIDSADLIYFDPPYCNSHADYQSFYHVLETYTEYWKDKQFVNRTKRYEPKRFSGFDKKKDVISSFNKLFEYSNQIPYWLISYNDRSYPNIQELTNIISKYRDITIERKMYEDSVGGKGSVAKSNEVLFVCKRRKHF